MTTVGIIIARAGSKGLANKNLRELGGKPLLVWTIEHALRSRRIDHVVLSSDSAAALELGLRHGIQTYSRPAELAEDHVTIDTAARHGAECWAQQHERTCDTAAILYGNVAIRPRDLTDRALAKLIETGADSVQSVFPVGKMHPLWMRQLGGETGDLLQMYQPNRVYRRQDLPPLYMLNGGVIALRWQSLFTVDPAEPHAFLGYDRRAIVTQAHDVIDIDSELDLQMAEVLVQERAAHGKRLAAGG